MPTTEVDRGSGTRGVRSKCSTCMADLAGNIDDALLRQPALFSSKSGSILSVLLDQQFDEVVKGLWFVGVLSRQVFLPVDPTPHVFTVMQLLDKADAGHYHQYRRFCSSPCRKPVIRH